MVDEDKLGISDHEANLPYSKGIMAQTLMATGLSPERAYDLAAAVDGWLIESGRSAITFDELRPLAQATLGTEAGEALMTRLDRWRRLRSLERPLIILIGGTTGVGKSTLAAQLAHRHAFAPDRGLALGRLLGIDARHRGIVEQRQRLVHGAHIVVAQVGHDAAPRIGDAGPGRHQHGRDGELARERGGMQGAGAAEGEQGEVARIVAA